MRVAIVVGGGPTVWRDVAMATQLVLDTLSENPFVIAVNDAAAEFPGHLDAMATLHPEFFAKWRNERRQRGGNVDFEAWTHDTRPSRLAAEKMRLHPDRHGSSGLFALDVAIHLGFRHNILCGVPMDQGAHFRRREPWRDFASFRTAWIKAIPALRATTRSMSGWTAQQLGEPTAEWLLKPGDPAR